MRIFDELKSKHGLASPDLETLKVFFPYIPEIDLSRKVKSPFRNDKKPDCKWFVGDDGYVRFHDNVRGTYSVLGLIMEYHQKRFNSYSEICSSIRNALINGEMVFSKKPSLKVKGLEAVNNKTFVPIRVVMREWDSIDEARYSRMGFTEKDLESQLIFPIQAFDVYYNQVPRRIRRRGYGKYLGETTDSRFPNQRLQKWKLYFKDGQDPRFWSNTGDWMDLDRCLWKDKDKTIPRKGKYCIISKSFQENAWYWVKLGIPACSPQSEGVFSEEVLSMLQERYDYVFVNYDYEPHQFRVLVKYRRAGGIIACLTPSVGSKDITDFSMDNGDEKAIELCRNFLKQYP